MSLKQELINRKKKSHSIDIRRNKQNKVEWDEFNFEHEYDSCANSIWKYTRGNQFKRRNRNEIKQEKRLNSNCRFDACAERCVFSVAHNYAYCGIITCPSIVVSSVRWQAYTSLAHSLTQTHSNTHSFCLHTVLLIPVFYYCSDRAINSTNDANILTIASIKWCHQIF